MRLGLEKGAVARLKPFTIAYRSVLLLLRLHCIVAAITF